MTAVGTGAQDEGKGPQEDGLAGACFSRDDVETGSEGDREFIDQCVVGDDQAGEHRGSEAFRFLYFLVFLVHIKQY